VAGAWGPGLVPKALALSSMHTISLPSPATAPDFAPCNPSCLPATILLRTGLKKSLHDTIDFDTSVLMPAEPSTFIHRRPAPLFSGMRARIARSLAPAYSTLIVIYTAPASLSPSASLTASSLAFRVQRRSTRDRPLLGPQAAVVARRHRRRCRHAQGRSGRGRPAPRDEVDESGWPGGGAAPAATVVGGTAGTVGVAAFD